MNIHDTKYKEFSRYIQQQRRGDDSVARTQSISSIDDAGMYAPRSFDANSKLPKKKRKRKSFIGVLIGLVVLLAAAFAGLFVYVNMMSGKLHFGIDSDLISSLDGGSVSEPFYMLILGTDASQTRKDSGEYGDTWRADSIILTRIDPEKQSVTFISI
ncbi:MAG: hypothetical protein IJV62_00655, partial [Eggerthellaceae bacterium]|nr:hypothetical protein [Eggerthellaceae bacterium]